MNLNHTARACSRPETVKSQYKSWYTKSQGPGIQTAHNAILQGREIFENRQFNNSHYVSNFAMQIGFLR